MDRGVQMTTMRGEFYANHYDQAHETLRNIVHEFFNEPVDFDIVKFEVNDLTAYIQEYTINGQMSHTRGQPQYEVGWEVVVNVSSRRPRQNDRD